MTTQRASRQKPEIREFILANVVDHPGDIGTLTAKQFGISRTAVSRYMKRLVEEGLLAASGQTNARIYIERAISERFVELHPVPPSENEVWRAEVLPYMKNIPPNVTDICQYGFTEIFNNIIDHSESDNAFIDFKQTVSRTTMILRDTGVGIFEKIQKDFGYEDPRTALLDLSKGKLTSDPSRHSGEGIFFTSRMFDQFYILSGHLFYSKKRSDDHGWLVETNDIGEYTKGTSVGMTIANNVPWTAKDIFEKFQDDDFRFSKTYVPISLSRYPGEQLVSRSQAKRLLSRFERFSEIMLDFSGIEEIGQAFADEVFRVFPLEHPNTHILYVNTSDAITKMIGHVRDGGVQLALFPGQSSEPQG